MPRSVHPRRLLAIALVAGAASLVLPGCLPKALRARQVTVETAAEDLFGGSDATGGVGDWVLSNGIVEAIVDDVVAQPDLLAAAGVELPSQTGLAPSGGSLVDLGTVGDHNDQLSALFPMVDYDLGHPVRMIPAAQALGDPSLGSLVASVDEMAGVASLTAYGRVVKDPALPLAAQQLAVRQTYSIGRRDRFVRILTQIRNEDPVAAVEITGVADVAVLGPGGPAPFVPWPGVGFDLQTSIETRVPFVAVFGLIGPESGPVHESGRPTGEVSYAIAAPTDPRGPYLRSGTNASVWVAGTAKTAVPIAPGAVFTWERRVYVGRGGDVDSSARRALRDFAAVQGYPVGQLNGRLVTPDGTPFRASLEITQLDRDPATPALETIVSDVGGVGPVPITQIRTDSRDRLMGGFHSYLPAGRYEMRIRAEGRQSVGPLPFDVHANAMTSLGTIELSSDGALLFEVIDPANGALLPARITIKGKNVPDPRFGAPFEVSFAGIPVAIGSRATNPYGNTAYAASGTGELRLPPGEYRVIASRGLEYDVAWQDVVVTAGGVATAHFELPRVVDTNGWIAADFHVHASPSADSSVPPQDRIASLAGEGVEVFVSADHDMLFDYAPVIAQIGMEARIASFTGTEATSNRGPAPFTAGVGHFNGWPLALDPIARKNGAPEDDGVEPNVIYDRLRARGARIVQINHPEWDALGLLATLGYDPLLPITAAPNDFLLRTSALGTGTRNIDADAIEVLNGLTFGTWVRARDVWMSLLDQGHRITATAASDTHRLSFPGAGLPRTYVRTAPDDPASIDGPAFDASLAAMRAIGTSGPFVEAELLHHDQRAGIGETLTETSGTVALHVRVQAPCWIPVGDLRVFANGTLFLSVYAGAAPCTGALRFEDSFVLAPTTDTYYVVELEERVPRDTSSFYKQVATLLYAGMPFRAFTNPLFLDSDGNGVFDPPTP